MSCGAASVRRAAPLALRELRHERTQSQPAESAAGSHTQQRPKNLLPERNHNERRGQDPLVVGDVRRRGLRQHPLHRLQENERSSTSADVADRWDDGRGGRYA